MDRVADQSVQLIVTSPPYWQLKDYGAQYQIGFNDSYEDYINNLNLVWQECHRVLHPGCRMVINIGDQFARSIYYGRYKVIPIRTEIIRFCETIGLDYLGAIIWQKKTTLNTTGGATVMGSYPFPRNGIVEIDYEFILIFKKPGMAPKVTKEIKEQSRLTKERWRECFSGHWHFGGERQDQHLAMFPVELPKRALEMFTFVGETVLDPFLGSGTTALAALRTQRNSIGYEINPEFIKTISQKMTSELMPSTGAYDLLFEGGGDDGLSWPAEIEKLPYKFTDPVQFEVKAKSKQASFGSKVKAADGQREHYYTVREILSPNLIRLNDGRTVRLLGVKPKSGVNGATLEFLHLKFDKSAIYLKYDDTEQDDDGNVLAYVYLKNRTFINAHLIKRGLAEVDEEVEFKHREKFLHYQRTSRLEQ